MRNSYFMKIYKKRWSYRILALTLYSVIIIFLLSAGIYQYYQNTNNPIIIKTSSDCDNAIENDSYVKVTAEKLYGLNLVMKDSDNRTMSNFVAINIDGKLLSVSLPSKEYEKIISQNQKPYVLRGKLTEFKDEELGTFRNSLIKEGISPQKVDSLSYSYYLDCKTPMDIALIYFTFAAILLIFLLSTIVPVMYKNISALKRLKKYSNGDLEFTCHQIDQELNAADVYKCKPITVTKNYMMVDTQQIVFAMPLSELMWVYKRVVKNKYYGFIPAGSYLSYVFVFSDKSTYNVSISKSKSASDDFLNYIANRCTKTYVGYSDELSNLFKKNPDEFVSQWRHYKIS